jgi:hypothetical protein
MSGDIPDNATWAKGGKVHKVRKVKGYDGGGFVEGMTGMMSAIGQGYDMMNKVKKARKESGSDTSSVAKDSVAAGSSVSKTDPQDTATPKSSAPPRVKDDDAGSTSFARGGKVNRVMDHRSQYMKKGKR